MKISLFFIAVLLQIISANVWAEGVLMDVAPKDNSVISASTFDNKVTLAFSGNVSDRMPSLVVLDSNGMRVDNQDLILTVADDRGRSVLTATTKNLAVGRYVVRYRVVTKDGLIVSGICRFEIKA